tara:strand:- start:1097 stop:1813 length:717 start_codon:yes stop_codon:yes gene_type:complete
MKIVNLSNKILHPLGAQLVRYPYLDVKRRLKLINYYKINKILDIGASVGLYGLEMRSLNFKGKILSFEPLRNSFKTLKKNSQKDKNWEIYNYALGNENKETHINIAGNSDSSSILEMTPKHIEGEPSSKYTGKERIKLFTLDSIFKNIYEKNDNIYMKIDTQGFEKNVLKGSKNSLEFIKGIQIEMSLKPLYKGSLLYLDMIKYLQKYNFELVSLENGFSNHKTGELLQVDGIFFKKQ